MLSIRIAFLALVLGITNPANADSTAEFNAILDEVWQWQLETQPLFASNLGDRRYNDRWADSSLNAISRQHGQTRAFLRRIYAIDRAEISADDKLNYELFRRQLQDDVDVHQFNGHLMPFSHRGGVQTLEGTTNYLRFETRKDYDDWLARLGMGGLRRIGEGPKKKSPVLWYHRRTPENRLSLPGLVSCKTVPWLSMTRIMTCSSCPSSRSHWARSTRSLALSDSVAIAASIAKTMALTSLAVER